MPYISTEEVKEKRNLIRKAFPDFKISVRCRHYSCIDVSIMEAPFNMIPDNKDGYEQVNRFYIKEHYKDNPKTRKVLEKILDIANNGNYTQFEDGDYGSIPSFYTHINIGSWDKPLVVKSKKSKK